jgi:hypothetical protein
MSDQSIAIVADVFRFNGGVKGRVEARQGEELVHADTIDLCSAVSRTRFSRAVAKLSGCNEAESEVNALLLERLDEETRGATPQGSLDIQAIVRPELFITPHLIGLAVPECYIADNKPAGRWRLCLRWSDGRREVQPLGHCIDLPGDARLWVHPTPAEPSPNTSCGWHPRARQAWADGAESPDPVDVYQRIGAAVEKFIDFPAEHAHGIIATLSLWMMMSYIYPAWPAVPYLFAGGPAASGKTRLFDVLGRLVFRPLMSSNMTAAALFRTLNDRGGCLLLDEAERLKESTPDVAEIKSILLSGYRRGGRATRLEPVGDSFRPVEFDVFGPKALACIAGLPPALSSRCIHVGMFRAPPGSDKPKLRLDEEPLLWSDLRDDLYALTLGPMGEAALDLAGQADVCGLSGRDFELWQPLMALAGWLDGVGADGVLTTVMAHATYAVDAGRDEQVPDADELVLRLLAEAVDGMSCPTPSDLLAQAVQHEPMMFQKWSPRGISNLLKRYGIRATKIMSRRVYRNVTPAMLLQIQRAYGLDLGFPDDEVQHPPISIVPCVPIVLKPVGRGQKVGLGRDDSPNGCVPTPEPSVPIVASEPPKLDQKRHLGTVGTQGTQENSGWRHDDDEAELASWREEALAGAGGGE